MVDVSSRAISLKTRKAAPEGAGRRVLLALTGAILVCAAIQASVVLQVAASSEGGAAVGMDLRTYMARTNDWLAGDGFYRDRQLAGPYVIETDDSLYPPTLLYLLVPFTVL